MGVRVPPLAENIKEGIMGEYTIELKKDELDKKLNEVAKRYKKDLLLPGFRKGRAPIPLIKVRFQKELEAETFEAIASEKLEEIINKYKPFIYGGPTVNDIKKEDSGDVTLKIELDVPPDIEIDYSGLDINLPSKAVTDKDIKREVQRLKEINAELKPVKRSSKEGDSVLINIEYKGGKISNYSMDIKDDALSKHIVGIKQGETTEIELETPENFYIPELSGYKGKIKIEMLEIKKKVYPKIDDEFAKNMGFKSLNEMQKSIKEQLEKEKSEKYIEEIKGKIIENIINKYNFEPPKSLLASLEKRFKDRKKALKEAKKIAILDKIVLKENLEITEEEIDKKIEEIAEGVKEEEVLNAYKENIKTMLLREKALDFLVQEVTK